MRIFANMRPMCGENSIIDRDETLKSINQGLQEYADGKVHTHKSIKSHFKAYVKERKERANSNEKKPAGSSDRTLGVRMP